MTQPEDLRDVELKGAGQQTGGCMVPLITPLKEDLSVCGQSVAKLMDQMPKGIIGFIPCLSTGEGDKLTEQQWRAMLGYCLQNSAGKKVIAGVLGATTLDIVDRCIIAQAMGADGVIVGFPHGQRISQVQIINYFKRIHDSINIELYLYLQSAVTIEPTLATLLKLSQLPRVRGIKDSSGNNEIGKNISRFIPHDVTLFQGMETALIDNEIPMGNIVSLANIEADLCVAAAKYPPTPVIRKAIQTKIEAFKLLESDWYFNVKSVLTKRGVITTDIVFSR